MEKGIKTKLKEAKRLYQQYDFVSCRELLKEVLNVDRKNYNALVLNGACCDHLGLDDIGVDYFFDAIQLEPDNALAWQGLFQLGTKNTDRYHASLVCVCMKLLQFYDSPECAEKKTTCGRILIELLVRYRLELPDGLHNLQELCRFVLMSAPSNSFALELSIRLKVERFLFVGLPHLISPTLLDSSLDNHEFGDIVDELLDSETSTQIDDLMDSVKRLGEIGSKTAAATARLGTMVITAGRLLSELNKHTRVGWQSLFEQIEMVEINGCRGLTNWLQRGYMDLHVTCLHALVAYQLHLFDHCETVLGKILAYCSQQKLTAAEEAHRLSLFPTTPLSQLDGFLTPRPMCTPIRSVPSDFSLNLSETSRSKYDVVEEWAVNLRLANAAASEQVSFASRLALEFIPSYDGTYKSTSLWSNVMRTLLVECCLTGCRLEHAFRILCPVEWDDLNLDIIRTLVPSSSDQSTVRFRLCSLWATTEFILRSNTANEQTQLVLAEFADVAHAVAESLQTMCSARDHFLLARLFSLLDLAAGGSLQDVSKMVQLELYEAGVAADEAYYANNVCLGKLYREAGNVKEALFFMSRAHELMPNSPEVTYQFALTLCQNNDLEKALSVYNSMDQIHFSKLMWLNYGLIAMRLKRSTLCVAALQKVVILDSKNALYWELLGEAYLLRGSYETALKALHRSVLLDPTRSLAHIRFGQASRRLGDFELANKHFILGLDYARSQEQAKTITHGVILLALKELVETNLLLARTHLREGLSGRAIKEFQLVMKYLDQAFELSSSASRTPLWAYHYAASAFSLFSVIDDPDFCVHLPHRFSSVLRSPAEQSVTDDDVVTHMCPYTGLQLAGVYLACTYQRWISTPKSQSADNQPESSVISRGTLLISLGLHCLSYARCLLKYGQPTNPTSITLLSADQLLLMAESALKRALSALTERAAIDQCFLDEHQSEEIIAEVKKIAQVEASPEEFARERLATNRTLRAKAWYALAVLYSTVEGEFSEHVDYCLCQALLARPDSTEAGVSLAVRMLHLGRTQFASSLLAHFQASDPDNCVVWLACAHLNAVTGVSEAEPCHGMKPWACSENTVLKNLLQAACLGANVPVALHLADNLFPLLIDAVSGPIYGESNITSSDHSKETRTFLRLAMEVATEALNRALAYEPQNPRLWHNRGLLLQLAGLSAPAEFCLRKAYSLFAGLTPSAQSSLDLQLACSQCFLITCVRGEPDWTLANRLVFFSEGCNPTACASVAEAFAKGLIYLHHPELSEHATSASICLIDELLRLAQQGVAAAIAVTLACPNTGRWLLVLHHLNQSGPHDLLLSQLFELLSSGSPVSPHLARTICSLVVRLQERFPDLDKNAVAYLHHFCHSQLQNTHQVHHHVENGFTGHNLCEQGRLLPTELASWAVDVANLVNLTSGQTLSGMACLSKFVACQPDDPNRWIALANWLVDHYCLEASGNPVLSDRTKKENRKNFCVWKTLVHVLQVALVSQSSMPNTSLFADTLTRCARCWLAVSRTSTLAETVVPVLLKGLRRAAALFPNTPDLLTQLMLFTTHHCKVA